MRGKGKLFFTYAAPEEEFKVIFCKNNVYLVGKIHSKFKLDEHNTIEV